MSAAPGFLARFDRRKALIVGLGGAVFNFAFTWAYQALLELFFDVRALDVAFFLGPFFVVFFGGFALFPVGILFGFLGWPMRLYFLWAAGCGLLWLLSLFMGPIPLWLYLPYWALFGVLVPIDLQAKPKSSRQSSFKELGKKTAKEQQQRQKQRERGAALSNYGRIPQSTVDLATQWVQASQNVVREALPGTAPALWRHVAVKAILDHLFNAWAQNGVRQTLDAQNQAMVADFLKLSAALAGDGDDPLADAVFRVSLNALLDSWRGPLRR